ncbi:MAG TPA: MATE family efflux transporter [Steroidobacteraceae bacterium]|nr:MATE family efflux transporter [Steroidobacteraceae bacterium]
MRDLTQGSIARRLVAMAVPIAAGMLFQTLYFLVDLYFVAALGDTAIAGVGFAGNVSFVILALTQMLGVGTVALVSHAVGRKDQPEANLIFNQSVLLSGLLSAATLIAGYALTGLYVRAVASDQASALAGISYLHWYLPGLALQFAMVAMASALRGTGIVQPTMVVQVLTVLLNTVLAPVLIAGWGTHHPLGVAGAGLASTLSIAAGVVFLWMYFVRLEHYVALNPAQWRPEPGTWKRILNIGLPAGGEFLMIFLIVAVVYWTIRNFGPAAQAGYGIASRVMQAIFLPAMALAFAASPVAGQNFGAGRPERVKETFRVAALMSAVIMAALTLLCRWRPELLLHPFTRDPQVIAVGGPFLRIISWNFVATGLIFTCSSLFQALGNTWPSLLSSASRLVTFVLPALWLGMTGAFQLSNLWYLSVTTVTLQAVLSVILLRQQFRSRLTQRPHASVS